MTTVATTRRLDATEGGNPRHEPAPEGCVPTPTSRLRGDEVIWDGSLGAWMQVGSARPAPRPFAEGSTQFTLYGPGFKPHTVVASHVLVRTTASIA